MKNKSIGKSFIGERLKQFRAEKQLSQSQLSALSLINIAQISRYENNTAAPNAIIVKKLSNALGISYNELAGYTNIQELNMNDFNKSVELARTLPKSDLLLIKVTIPTWDKNHILPLKTNINQ